MCERERRIKTEKKRKKKEKDPAPNRLFNARHVERDAEGENSKKKESERDGKILVPHRAGGGEEQER